MLFGKVGFLGFVYPFSFEEDHPPKNPPWGDHFFFVKAGSPKKDCQLFPGQKRGGPKTNPPQGEKIQKQTPEVPVYLTPAKRINEKKKSQPGKGNPFFKF